VCIEIREKKSSQSDRDDIYEFCLLWLKEYIGMYEALWEMMF